MSDNPVSGFDRVSEASVIARHRVQTRQRIDSPSVFPGVNVLIHLWDAAFSAFTVAQPKIFGRMLARYEIGVLTGKKRALRRSEEILEIAAKSFCRLQIGGSRQSAYAVA